MLYSINDIKPGDMLWFVVKGADQNFGFGEVKSVHKDKDTGIEFALFSCQINGGLRGGRLDQIIDKPTQRMENKLLERQREFREALREHNK